VFPDTNSFYCFGCGAGGDAITFIKNIQNLDYVEAVKFLAARMGMPMPDEDDSASKLRGRVLMINRETARYYVECLNADIGRDARGYLRGRGLSDGIMRRFGVGFAPNEFGALLSRLRAQGFSEEELLVAGVCKRSAKGNLYDAFRNRVMFPIIDLRGNVIAFGGRAMPGENGAKYLNSSDTPVFKKSRGLFALNLAKKSASRRYLLVEGYMDVISLHQAGFDTAVASLGTAFAAEQAKLISDYADEVVICYDADEAGQKATARALNILKDTQLKVTVLSLPDAKDPDEYIKKYGAARFEQLLGGSRNAIEYALQKVKGEYDLTEAADRAGYVRAALEVLVAEASPAEQDIYAGRIAEEAGVAKSAVLTQLENVNEQRRRRLKRERDKRLQQEGAAAGITVPYTAGGTKALGVAFAEQQLVTAILKNPTDFLPLAKSRVRPEQFIVPEMAEVYKLLLQKGEEGEYIDLTILAGEELPEKAMALLSRVLAQNHGTGFERQDMELFLDRIEQAGQDSGEAAEMNDEEWREHMKAKRNKKK
jgi:DNA primase